VAESHPAVTVWILQVHNLLSVGCDAPYSARKLPTLRTNVDEFTPDYTVSNPRQYLHGLHVEQFKSQILYFTFHTAKVLPLSEKYSATSSGYVVLSDSTGTFRASTLNYGAWGGVVVKAQRY
jgi:hypothetical protein